MGPEYRITLSEADQRLVVRVAAARYEANRTRHVKDRSICGSVDIDLNGYGGEVAFCRLYEIDPDFDIGPRSSERGTDFGDCILKGQRIDVKTTEWQTGRLLAVSWKRPDVDYFALMVGKFPTYECRGFMAVDDLLQPGRLMDLGRGLTYAAPQSDLIFTKERKAA